MIGLVIKQLVGHIVMGLEQLGFVRMILGQLKVVSIGLKVVSIVQLKVVSIGLKELGIGPKVERKLKVG